MSVANSSFPTRSRAVVGICRHRQNVRKSMLFILAFTLFLQLGRTQQSSDLPRIPLRIGLYVNPEVRDYDPDVWLGNSQHLRVGFWLSKAAEDLGNNVFASVRVLFRYPPPTDSKDFQDLDCVLAVEAVHFESDFSLMTWTMDIDDSFAVYTTDGNRVFGSTEKQTQKVRFGWKSFGKSKAQEAANEAIASTVRQFLSKFAKTELATTPSAKAAPSSVGTLMLSTEPAGAQVYLDDQFKGITSEQEGKLVVGNVPAGTHRLGVSQAGHKDWAQSITVSPGEELNVQAKLVSAGPAPLTLKEVEDALSNGVSKGRVTTLVNQYGVNFVLTNEAEQRLRNAGADSDLLLAIAKNRK
jgi:PEGA domain